MDADVLARLQSHEKAFEGLMSLTPADVYYGKNNEDQWQKKKQTKEEKRMAKRAKLAPGANKSALDVHREKELKRKRETSERQQHNEGTAGDKDFSEGDSKKAKLGDDETKRIARAEKQAAKRERKKIKNAKLKEKNEAKKARRNQQTLLSPTSASPANQNPKDASEIGAQSSSLEEEKPTEDANAAFAGDNDLDVVDVSGLADDVSTASPASSADASIARSPVFDEPEIEPNSTTSSTSSIVPPAKSADDKHRIKQPKLAIIDTELLQERLRVRLEALRAQRKADGINGKPARNRQELIEGRRRKEEQRRAHKKELRAKSKEKEREEAEAEAARLRGGSNSPNLFSPIRIAPENHFGFGRMTFDDGQELDNSLTGVVDHRKKRGPHDTKTALELAQRKQARLEAMDEAKRVDIEDKDIWLNARKRIHGEKIKDDVSLLKKTLKRKDKGKAKSEKEWTDRLEGIKKSQEIRQHKREENLQKRKDDKGKSGKGSKGGKGGKKPAKKRPGFEGSFKASHRPKNS